MVYEWMAKESESIKEQEKRGGSHQPFFGTWVADFMLRHDEGKFMLKKYLSDKTNLWR